MAQPKKILDFGCGNGNYINYLANRGQDVCGIDLDISSAKKNYPSLKFFAFNGESLPFNNSSFDEVCAWDVLEHIDNLPSALKEISRIIKPRGMFRLSVPYYKSERILARIRPQYFSQVGHRRVFMPGELERLLAEQGFKIVKIRRRKAFLHILLAMLFLLKKDIVNQRGEMDDSFAYNFLIGVNQFFDWDITGQTRAKYLPLWLIGWPLEWLMDRIMPKSIMIEAEKVVAE